jgi:hypothetical protein
VSPCAHLSCRRIYAGLEAKITSASRLCRIFAAAYATGVGAIIKAMARRIEAEPHQTAAYGEREKRADGHGNPAMQADPWKVARRNRIDVDKDHANQQGNEERANDPRAQTGFRLHCGGVWPVHLL